MAQSSDHSSRSRDTHVSQRIVRAVATARDVDPLDLPPLYSTIDPDPMDRLFRYSGNGAGSAKKLEFEYHGHAIVVTEDGTVTVDGTDYEN